MKLYETIHEWPPDKLIGKHNFAAKLADTQFAFYKTSILVSSFKATGIYPICRDVIANETLRPLLTFEEK